MALLYNDPVLERNFKAHKGSITGVDFNPNGKQIVSGSMDGTVMVWHFEPQKRSYRFHGHNGTVTGVRFSPSGSLIASCSTDLSIRLWVPDIKGDSTVVKSAHSRQVRTIDFSPDGQNFISGGDDKVIKVWQTHRQKFLFSLTGHSNWVKTVKYSPDGHIICSGGDDKGVKIWDVNSKECVHTYPKQSGQINSVDFHPKGTCIASASADGSIRIWDIRMNKLVQHYNVHTGVPVTGVSFHSSGNYLLASSQDSNIRILDLQEGRVIYTIHGHKKPATCVAFSKDSSYFVSGGADNQVMVWKTNFDSVDYQEFINSNKRRSGINGPRPHLHDIHPGIDVEENAESGDGLGSVEVNGDAPRNKKYDEVDITEVAPTLGPERLSKQFGKSGINELNNDNESTVTTLPMEELNIPTHMRQIMEVLISQMELFSQTVTLLEQRITIIEDRLKDCIENQNELQAKMGDIQKH